MTAPPFASAEFSPPRLEPKDAALLAVLGATHLGHGSLLRIVGAARGVGGGEGAASGRGAPVGAAR